MIELLGYAAYALICAFNPLQLFANVRGKNLNLGFWPLLLLVAGLFLLQATYFWVTVPTYVIVGTAISGSFCALNLAHVLSTHLGDRRTEKHPPQVYDVINSAGVAPLGASIGSPPLSSCEIREDITECTFCRCILFRSRAKTVRTYVVNDPEFEFLGVISPAVRAQRNKYAIDVQDYCPACAPEYDDIEVTFGQPGVKGVQEFFQRVPSETLKAGDRIRIQVNEDGSLFD